MIDQILRYREMCHTRRSRKRVGKHRCVTKAWLNEPADFVYVPSVSGVTQLFQAGTRRELLCAHHELPFLLSLVSAEFRLKEGSCLHYLLQVGTALSADGMRPGTP